MLFRSLEPSSPPQPPSSEPVRPPPYVLDEPEEDSDAGHEHDVIRGASRDPQDQQDSDSDSDEGDLGTAEDEVASGLVVKVRMVNILVSSLNLRIRKL